MARFTRDRKRLYAQRRDPLVADPFPVRYREARGGLRPAPRFVASPGVDRLLESRAIDARDVAYAIDNHWRMQGQPGANGRSLQSNASGVRLVVSTSEAGPVLVFTEREWSPRRRQG